MAHTVAAEDTHMVAEEDTRMGVAGFTAEEGTRMGAATFMAVVAFMGEARTEAEASFTETHTVAAPV